jgi:hypothetical protein
VTVGLAEQPSYVARFPRTVVVLMLLAGPASVAVVWTLVDIGALTHHQGAVLGFVVAIPALVMMGIGIGRLVRGLSSDWVALAIDAEGIYFGAQPREEPRRFSWDEISALVFFARRTEFIQGTVKCVGVRLHPCTADSPERYLQDMDRLLGGSDLSPREREELNRLRDFDMENAVSFHIEVRGWRRRPAQLRKAMRTHAPGVPIIRRRSADYHDLVGWRAGRDLTERTTSTMWS